MTQTRRCYGKNAMSSAFCLMSRGVCIQMVVVTLSVRKWFLNRKGIKEWKNENYKESRLHETTVKSVKQALLKKRFHMTWSVGLGRWHFFMSNTIKTTMSNCLYRYWSDSAFPLHLNNVAIDNTSVWNSAKLNHSKTCLNCRTNILLLLKKYIDYIMN